MFSQRRRRPPWWPADEPFPPDEHTRHEWRRMRGRFFRRVGCLFLFLFLLTFTGFAALGWFIGNGMGVGAFPYPWSRFGPLGVLGILLVVLGVFAAVRSLRGIAMPLGDLMEASGRVANGDYSARVEENGPREVRQLARAFNKMTARLEETDERRRNLLADVTHELRTPLTVIQGNLEGLLDGVYPRDEAHLAPILEETRILSRLIDDLRTLALAESGALKLQREPTDIRVLAREAVTFFKAQADLAGVELRAEAENDLPMLDLDPSRLRQVVDNLIANALRYTPRGGTILVRCSLETDAPRRVALAVVDTGRGIPAQDLEHIFDRFYKSSDSRGAGLGLAIAKNLVAAHGGAIAATSEAGQGTTIRFTLPVEKE